MHFQDCGSAREVKRTFNRISRELHPDKGGTKEAFVKLFDQYQEAKQKFSDIAAQEDAKKEDASSFPEEADQRKPSWDRWWAKLSQQALWDLVKAEQKANNKAIERHNQDCLKQENRTMNEERSWSKRDRAFLNVNYDTLGSVGEMFVSRQAQTKDCLLAEMKRKREKDLGFKAPTPTPPPAHSFKAPPYLRPLQGRNTRKRKTEREMSEEKK